LVVGATHSCAEPRILVENEPAGPIRIQVDFADVVAYLHPKVPCTEGPGARKMRDSNDPDY